MLKLFIASLFILYFSSCINEQSSEKSELYLDTLVLNYNKPIVSGDWLEIDDLIFHHTFRDTLASNVNLKYLNDKKFDLPTTFNYSKIEGANKYLRDDYTNYQMAVLFLQSLEEFEMENQKAGKTNIYKFVGYEYELFEGKVKIARLDSEKIKVTLSDGYKSVVVDKN